MTKPVRFRQTDAKRAMKAAVDAGLKPSECVIDPTGCIRLVFGSTPTSKGNPLDRLL